MNGFFVCCSSKNLTANEVRILIEGCGGGGLEQIETKNAV